MRVIAVIFCFLFCSCSRQERNLEVDQQEMKYDSLREDLLRSFPVLAREAKGLLRLQDCLRSEGISTDSLYVYDIDYSDSLCTISDDSNITVSNPLYACFAIFNIKHKINVDYFKKIEEENARMMEEHKGEDWIPLIVPSKPTFLKKDIIGYYYFDQDSVAIADYNLQ